MSAATYKKSEGTSGIRGQLYETKLLSMIFYRAKIDDSIEEFQLASNIAEIGAFDDICFKVKVKGFPKPLIVFIQAKHKDDSEQTLNINMMKYFRSYLKIRERLESDFKDDLFQGKFQETESFFVIYTSGKDTFDNDPVESDIASKLNELIGTEGTAKQPYKHNADKIKCLCQTFMEDQTISLAKQLATFVSGERNFQMMLSDELILTYHVVLALKVVDISAIEQDGQRIATFRQDFFDTKDRYLILFKDTFYKEILERRKIETSDVNNLLSEFLAEPTDVTKLSKLIGTVLTYNNGQLEIIKTYTQHFNHEDINSQLHQVDVSRLTVNKALDLAAREILSKGLKVPAAFGNKDLILSGSDTKKSRRIKYLTSKVKDLVSKSKASNIVTIDNSLENGFLKLNGGIAGAIGNLFVLDDNTKLMKITDNWALLGDHAQKLYKKLTDEIVNLHEIRFCLRVNNIPKLFFDCSEYEETLARDFLSKLLFYSKQADENQVEEILKDKIEDHLDHLNYLQARTDAIFLKYHDKIQKWWMQPEWAPYLTKDSDIFENAVNHIIKDPLLSSINLIYMSKIKHLIDYTFTEDVVSSLNLQNHSGTVIITKNSKLTVVKVLQHFKNKDHVVLDLEYIVNLPKKDRNVLGTELKNINEEKLIVFVCNKIQNSTKEIKTFEKIANIILTKKTIIITSSVSVVTLQNYFPRADSPVHDENSLIDMSEESQKSILETTRVMFQGVEVRLGVIIDDKSKEYVKGDILTKIISKETIQLGKLIVSRDYGEKKHLYIDRKVHKANGPTLSPKTLYNIEGDVVLVTAEPGTGKSTLLTHLSLITKKDRPEVWIVRVNLLEYSKELSKWKEDETAVDLLQALKFMCQVILRMKLGNEYDVTISLEEQNGCVYLKHCTGDQSSEFELKLFLHFFNVGKMIFLFDGFDEISPHYINEAVKCIEVINNHPKKHKVWVTSRPYTKIETILQRAFGEPYKIEHFSYETKEEYLNKIWESNLNLKELDTTQLENVHGFLQFISESEIREWHALYEIYVNAGYFLLNRIKYLGNTCEFYPSYDDTFYDNLLEKLRGQKEIFNGNIRNLKEYKRIQASTHKNPLNLFLVAHYFISRIKDVRKNSNNWNKEVDPFTFYEHFLETKLKQIRFKDKDGMDIYNPSIKLVYDKELADCIAKHKKLAAYTVFNPDIDKLFVEKDLQEIKETIKCIEKGEEKTGLISSVVNGIPIFIHMTFAEYFAVEYVCDLLKNANESENLIIFVFEVILSGYQFDNVRRFVDYKIKIDKTLMSVIENNREVIFSLLIEKDERLIDGQGHCWGLIEALYGCCRNIISLYMSIFEKFINSSNFDQFLEIVIFRRVYGFGYGSERDELRMCINNIARKLDISRLLRFRMESHEYVSFSNDRDPREPCYICECLQRLIGETAGQTVKTIQVLTKHNFCNF